MTIYVKRILKGGPADSSGQVATPDLTRGDRKCQLHKFTGELVPKGNSYYLSHSQWLQLPNPTARRRVWGGQRADRNKKDLS